MDKQAEDTIFLIVVTTGLIFLFAGLIVNLLLLVRNRQIKHQSKLLQIKADFEQELSATRLEVIESTLAEVSGDLHDDVGQMLTVAILELNRLEGAGEAKAAVRSGLESVRNISKSLSPDFMKTVGLREALLRMTDRVNKQGAIRMMTNLHETGSWKDQNQALYVYRILQELVTNTIKYAQASQIDISLELNENEVILLYRDNGIGLDAPASHYTTGQGLLNVQRRVSVLNGTIQIISTPGMGFLAEIKFPAS